MGGELGLNVHFNVGRCFGFTNTLTFPPFPTITFAGIIFPGLDSLTRRLDSSSPSRPYSTGQTSNPPSPGAI